METENHQPRLPCPTDPDGPLSGNRLLKERKKEKLKHVEKVALGKPGRPRRPPAGGAWTR